MRGMLNAQVTQMLHELRPTSHVARWDVSGLGFHSSACIYIGFGCIPFAGPPSPHLTGAPAPGRPHAAGVVHVLECSGRRVVHLPACP